MLHLRQLLSLSLISALPLSCSTLVHTQFSNADGTTSPNSSPFSTYPDGSASPLNPGPGGRWNDDEYNTRKQQALQRQHRQSQPSYELPAAPVTKDFNVWKDGKPALCTQTKQDVYCY
jgi:hypothetical protein